MISSKGIHNCSLTSWKRICFIVAIFVSVCRTRVHGFSTVQSNLRMFSSRSTASQQSFLSLIDSNQGEAIMFEKEQEKATSKLEGKLMKQMRQASLKYEMIEDGDHIMCCVSGGKDSATMLHLLLNLQKRLASAEINFKVTAVHLNQMQPGYDGTPLINWLDTLVADHGLPEYKIITENTYSIVLDKTAENKTYCSMCSRLRRGILYSIAHDIEANKIALGHHADDAIQTLLLNFIHAGQMKAMPARYYSSSRDMHVIRPLIFSMEEDIETFARAKDFPILPCNLCGTQPDAQRAKVKMLVDSTFTMLNPNAKRNMVNAMGDIRPSHLLDVGLREACGLDGVTGEIIDQKRAGLIKGYEDKSTQDDMTSDDSSKGFESKSKIESLL